MIDDAYNYHFAVLVDIVQAEKKSKSTIYAYQAIIIRDAKKFADEKLKFSEVAMNKRQVIIKQLITHYYYQGEIQPSHIVKVYQTDINSKSLVRPL